jgi:hypothetical protein
MNERLTKAQRAAIKALKADINRLDRASRVGPSPNRRRFKRWSVVVRLDGVAVVESVVGWPGHPFDDIFRKVYVGRRGGLRGFGNRGHGKAGDTRTHRGPRVLYEIDAERVY